MSRATTALAGKAAAFHDQFVANLHASAGSFAATEAASAAALRPAAGGLSLNSLLDSAQALWAVLPQSLIGALSVVGQFIGTLVVAAVFLTVIGIVVFVGALVSLLGGLGLVPTG